jgi:trimethylamine---corrinoid protein Co-methyltransferase
MSGVDVRTAGRWQVLWPEQVERLHEATLRLLSEVGVVFHGEEALDVLRLHGVPVDGHTAHFPPRVVRWAIETSPAEVTLHARDPQKSVLLGNGRVHYTSCFGPVRVRPLGSSQTLPATLDDLRRFTILSDALDNVAYCLFHVRPHEVPTGWHDVYSAAAMLSLTGKHIHFSQDTADHTDLLIRLGEVAADAACVEGPVFSLGCCPTSPLSYTGDACVKLLKAVSRGIPFLVVSGAMAGGTSPATLAGTLLVQNAEVLAGVVLAELVQPGAPVIYGTFSGGMDMRSGSFVMGGVELALMQAASAQLCALYHIPLGYGSGGWTDAREPDVQAGLEKAGTLWAAALAGVEVIHSAIGGMLGGAEIADYAQMIVDDELCSMVNRALRGIEVSESTLAYDLIRDVGPGGQFLDTSHTAHHFRKEHFLPRILERVTGEAQIEGILARAGERAGQILETHRPHLLDPAAVREIETLVERAIQASPSG